MDQSFLHTIYFAQTMIRTLFIIMRQFGKVEAGIFHKSDMIKHPFRINQFLIEALVQIILN